MITLGYLNKGVFVCLDLRILRMGGRLDLCGGTVTRGKIVAGHV
jgi:hypothetical protein